MWEEKKERGDDLAGTKSGRSDQGEREKTSSGPGVLSLSRSSMSKDGKGEKERGWGFRGNGCSIAFGKGFVREGQGLR